MRLGSLTLAVLLMGCPAPGHSDAPPIDSDAHTDSDAIGFRVSGVVIEPGGAPVADAAVMLGGQPGTEVLTDGSGAFSLWYEPPERGDTAVVAYKQGFRAKAVEWVYPDQPITLVLRPVGADNLDYVYEDPGDGLDLDKEDCTHCHASMVRELLASKHAEAARNPLLHDLYAGVVRHLDARATCEDAGGRWSTGVVPGTAREAALSCYVGDGVLARLNPGCGGSGEPRCDDPSLAAEARPTAFGACADCHAPGIDGVAGGRDLHDAHGLAYDKGVHCDVCHKVREVDLSKPPGVGQRLVLGRPPEPGRDTFVWDPVFYGPIPDVPAPNMGGSIQPQFDQAVFCAGCHEQRQPALIPGQQLDAERWPDGLPVHSTYSEWLAGPYAERDTPCQHCHMPGDAEAVNALDSTTLDNQSILFGWRREPEDIRRHVFRGPLAGPERLIDSALYTSIQLSEAQGRLHAQVSVSNVGCGHAVPTGEPMRAVILLVEAQGACGELTAIGGHSVPDTGGALATGIVGEDVALGEHGLVWSGVRAEAGQVVRAVRPTGAFDDYVGVGVFARGGLPAERKGMELHDPVGEAIVDQVTGDRITLSTPLALQAGDRIYLGESAEILDGQGSVALAGHPGTAFSRVLLDAEGDRHVPHFRAVDMASDNRIPPGQNAVTSHIFSVPESCAEVQVRATLIYRPHPLGMAEAWGWDARDYAIGSASARWERE